MHIIGSSAYLHELFISQGDVREFNCDQKTLPSEERILICAEQNTVQADSLRESLIFADNPVILQDNVIQDGEYRSLPTLGRR